jgi:hypothetical protein
MAGFFTHNIASFSKHCIRYNIHRFKRKLEFFPPKIGEKPQKNSDHNIDPCTLSTYTNYATFANLVTLTLGKIFRCPSKELLS